MLLKNGKETTVENNAHVKGEMIMENLEYSAVNDNETVILEFDRWPRMNN